MQSLLTPASLQACLRRRLRSLLVNRHGMEVEAHAADNATTPMSYLCNGQPWAPDPSDISGGWIGHFLPGLLMLIWGTHWCFAIILLYLQSRRSGKSYTARAAHCVLSLPKHWPVESIIKLVLPPFAVMAELKWAHENQWRNLICDAQTARAGHLVVNQLNNWQHATMYPAYMLSGLIDLAALKLDFPQGTDKVFLASAFLIDGLVMGLHTKHTPLDKIVHSLLFALLLLIALFVLLEAKYPNNVLVSLGRVAAMLLTGTWFISVAQILYSDSPIWQALNPPDMAPSMFVPVYFCWHVLGVLAALLAVYVGMAQAYEHFVEREEHASGTTERTRLLDRSPRSSQSGDENCGVPSVELRKKLDV